MYLKKKLLVGISLFLAATIATASPPYLELASHAYSKSESECKADAAKALTKAGFRLKAATHANEDTVGVDGHYKGVVSCINLDVSRIIFIVTGSEYKLASEKLNKLVDSM